MSKKTSIFFISVLTLLGWAQIELSSRFFSNFNTADIDAKYIFLNIISVFCIWLLFFTIFNRYWLSMAVFGIFTTLLSFINYFTIEFHCMPFSIFEVKNLFTAANVLGTHTIRISVTLVAITLITAAYFFLCFYVKKHEEKSNYSIKKIVLIKSLSILFIFIIYFFGYFSKSPIKPPKTITWSWQFAYYRYGYIGCSIENIQNYFSDVVKMPSGYSIEKVNEIEINKTTQTNKTPDVILILNETFYDVSQITDITTDVPYMKNISNMKNVIKGYSVVPGLGGTNMSEYELLTSNSLYLTGIITPFNILNMNDANSITSHLNALGYTTISMHSETAANYSRGRAYSDMGFDKTYFDEDFNDKDYLPGKYYETDESLYKNLINWHNEELNNSDAPVFMYLLTIQNHSGWSTSDSVNDTVHVLNDYGENTEVLNEYLTGIKASDEAFAKLVEYYENSDRDVIICMVGDHGPSFTESIVDEQYSGDDKTLRLHSTPFVIWSNYKDFEDNVDYISMTGIVPLLLESAGITTSDYYNYINQLRDEVPVIMSSGMYMDINNKFYELSPNNEHYNKVMNYFYLEYNNLSKD